MIPAKAGDLGRTPRNCPGTPPIFKLLYVNDLVSKLEYPARLYAEDSFIYITITTAAANTHIKWTNYRQIPISNGQIIIRFKKQSKTLATYLTHEI